MSIDLEKSIFFGQPLIDAYLLQEEVYFYGTVIHGSAQERIENNKSSVFTENYLCHLKKGKSYHLTIAPINLVVQKKEHEIIERDKVFDGVKKMRYNTSGNLRNYIDQTEVYLNFVNDKYEIN